MRGIITSRRLWINIILIGLASVGILAGSLWWLKLYTKHGTTVSVPDLSRLKVTDLDAALHGTTLTFEITDSIYSDDYARGAVVIQNPPAGMQVKEGRTIFLTVNSILPEMVTMPDLTGKSRRIAIPMLEITGLRLESTKYVPDESCTDCVVDQLFNGKPIQPGQRIRKGERITLVIGQQSNEVILVPRLLGMTYEQSQQIIVEYRLNPGAILSCKGCYTPEDSALARVISQIPQPGSKALLGTFVDLSLTTDTVLGNTFVLPLDTADYETP